MQDNTGKIYFERKSKILNSKYIKTKKINLFSVVDRRIENKQGFNKKALFIRNPVLLP